MHTLFTYIKAIHDQPTSAIIVNESVKTNSYTEDGVEICEQEKIYSFHNGVIIRYLSEQDNAPSELACAECWISYEVLDARQLPIKPLRKSFHNHCQESFWMKIQQAQTEN